MYKISERIRDFLLREHYHLLESNEKNNIIRYKNQLIGICPAQSGQGYCSVNLPIFLTEEDDEDRGKLLRLCNAITSDEQVVKAFLTEDGLFISYEFNWEEELELYFHLRLGISQVTAVKNHVVKTVRTAFESMDL